MSETNENVEVTETATEVPTEVTVESLQAELDKWKGHARTWEDRAKGNQDAADKLKELEDAKKTELEKLVEQRDALEADLAAARFDAMRQSIAAEYGISKEDTELFLTGDNSEVLKAQAEALKARTTPDVRVGTHVPGLQDRNNGESDSKDSFARSLFGI